jgi:hypothetical protein
MYLEGSAVGAATSDGVGALQQDALGVLLRRCLDDGTDGVHVRLGGTIQFRIGDLGLAPAPDETKEYIGVGGELEASLPIRGQRLGLRGSAQLEGNQGYLFSFGPRWRIGAVMLGFDGIVTTKNDRIPSTFDYHRIWNEGATLSVGYDYHLGRTEEIVLGSAAGAFALYVLIYAAATGFRSGPDS